MFFRPKHTVQSVAETLSRGLASGDVVLNESQDQTASESLMSFHDHPAPPFLDNQDPGVRSVHQWYWPIKAIVEYVIAIALLIVALPLIAVAALCIKLTSSGPAFYLQTRLGKNGRQFEFIKLRTMVRNAEATTGAVWSTEGDPRVTRVGAFLRKTHIDEVPQLINVLRGEMAIIGPRPERPEIASQLEWKIPRYAQRLVVRPGIVGLAQLNLPPEKSVAGVYRKLLHDLYYIRYASPWLDLRIYIVTQWQFFATVISSALQSFLPRDREVAESIDTDHYSQREANQISEDAWPIYRETVGSRS